MEIQPYINKGSEIVEIENKSLTLSKGNVNDLPKYWEKDFINRVLNSIENLRHKVLAKFLWMTGCRVTEAINITKGDIDFKNYTVTIRWQKSKKGNSRNIPLHPELKNILEIYTAKLNQADRLFPISRQRAYTIIKNHFSGSPHQLRHSFAVNWLRCDGRLETLSQILGHSDIKITMIYLRIVPMDQGRELLKIDFN